MNEKCILNINRRCLVTAIGADGMARDILAMDLLPVSIVCLKSLKSLKNEREIVIYKMNIWYFNPPQNLLPLQIAENQWNLNLDFRLKWKNRVGYSAGFGYRENNKEIYYVGRINYPPKLILDIIQEDAGHEVATHELGMRLAEEHYYNKKRNC